MTSETTRPLDTYITREDLLKRPHRTSTAVDPANPLEVDDAINLEPINRECSEYRVAIHIADAGLLLGHTKIIDDARERGWTQYDFDNMSRSKPLVPENVFKHALGLDAQIPEGVPAIELAFDFSLRTRAIGNVGVSKARVQVEMIDYRKHDKRLRALSGNPKHTQARERLGVARRLFAEDSGVNPISSQRKSEDIVAYFMIAANRIIAEEMQNQDIPWLFRNHSGLAYVNWRDDRERRALEKIKPGAYGSQPIGHEGLKIDKYCHFTSPLRRFPDFANHLNLHAHMNGETPPYDYDEIDEIAKEMTALYIARNKRNITQNMAA